MRPESNLPLSLKLTPAYKDNFVEMSILLSAIEKLRLIADFTPEYEGQNVFSAIKEPYELLIDTYPRLKAYTIYLEFLKLTGGAYIDSPDFSLGLFGFGGYVVKSF